MEDESGKRRRGSLRRPKTTRQGPASTTTGSQSIGVVTVSFSLVSGLFILFFPLKRLSNTQTTLCPFKVKANRSDCAVQLDLVKPWVIRGGFS